MLGHLSGGGVEMGYGARRRSSDRARLPSGYMRTRCQNPISNPPRFSGGNEGRPLFCLGHHFSPRQCPFGIKASSTSAPADMDCHHSTGVYAPGGAVRLGAGIERYGFVKPL
ncbi:hypothetical protein QFZ96_002504 [Paraburkholderia youngii]